MNFLNLNCYASTKVIKKISGEYLNALNVLF
jgi:hypothetical protein